MARKGRDEIGAELAQSLMSTAAVPGAEKVVESVVGGMSQAFDFAIPPPDEDDAPPARTEMMRPPVGSQTDGSPDMAQIVEGLKKPGIVVTLPEVAQWTVAVRKVVWDWIVAGADGGAIPTILAVWVARRSVPVSTPTIGPADFPTREPAPKKADVAPPPKQDTDRAPPPKHPSTPPPARPPLFASANKGPGINPDMQRIVETLYAADAFKDYSDLESSLEIGEERTNYQTLMTHLDKAEQRARRAHRLYLGAKLELETWEQDAKKVTSVMRAQASAELEGEKAAGERKKAITNPDVDAKMSEMFADEYSSQALTRAKIKGAAEHLERIAELWKIRCHTLGTMLSNLRK